MERCARKATDSEELRSNKNSRNPRLGCFITHVSRSGSRIGETLSTNYSILLEVCGSGRAIDSSGTPTPDAPPGDQSENRSQNNRTRDRYQDCVDRAALP
jgi:hypothetical protein